MIREIYTSRSLNVPISWSQGLCISWSACGVSIKPNIDFKELGLCDELAYLAGDHKVFLGEWSWCWYLSRVSGQAAEHTKSENIFY